MPGKGKKSPAKAPVEPEIDLVAEATLIQVFLDRENFTGGPIDGNESGAFRTVAGIYLGIHPDLQAPDALRAKAVAVVGEPFTTYKLQPSDFRFISPPKATFISKPSSPPPVSHSKDAGARTLPAPSTAPSRPTVTYEELLAARFSAYRTPWEFVAERFHCDEAFLRRLNPNIKIVPTAETVFKVPNVTPFEIEKCFDSPLRPKADPEKPITAAIVERSRLEIRQGDQLIASMPMSVARPGLHGRGSWTILGAIAGPRLATRQEPTTAPKATTEPGVAVPSPEPTPPATLTGRGPNSRGRTEKSGGRLLDRSGEGRQHDTAAIWAARHRHSQPHEDPGKSGRTATDQLGHCPGCPDVARGHATGLEITLIFVQFPTTRSNSSPLQRPNPVPWVPSISWLTGNASALAARGIYIGTGILE